MQQTKRIALLIETSTSYGRALIRGILQYANVAASWVFYNEPRGIADALPNLSGENLDGIIMRDTAENMKLLNYNLPTVVSIRYENKVEGVPNIVSDCEAIGKMAADFLMERNYSNFAYCGFEDMPWSVQRREAFIKNLPDYKKISTYQDRSGSLDYESKLQRLAEWLISLPKPAALMACNDVRGASIIEACKLAGVRIPQELSILGVNNDDMICEMVSPELSSISLNITKAGYEAARTLDRLIKTGQSPTDFITVEPERVISRASTDIKAIHDKDLAAALHFISQHSRENIQVSDVAEAVCVNRRSLERRFRRILNRSVYDEIKRVRTNLMKKMLTETDMPVAEIAYTMGFDDANHISRYFKLQTGISPLKFRKQNC
ncbi:DNA-binding transcriptional regulator [Sedimentisphaera salicampi]|uniref:Xylose operon regulatory protein n=1 Tax=Sedimentisphaera salicampi TaxID=1941349 RepID=A0A1W6LMI3_9BACT|nr:DNA-binding transcriptional regulator [Sedimentisphaera salicampi]ARN56954.1 Xylose operon regulatory protein [Sedimentisphaera salicampi]OXU14797.1 Xylose operon regulatory protein [Sedimentisphaera salicampi]